ncbi:Dabb family protein [Aspergillus brunneoviolaceus CBS 621.78]|uniref:Stress responsive A/B barrel domain protein n=1 Tax=Aspergillus brunneoviolaceus CBS 621.78 TaxID=1450534 RepID=A0ACD1GAM4_9EURO|nr:stress responsive A/B barrel domain protein [Aspergillus brunneoviolaceus CBS 621.78]RAH46334.1 stress responsive A/B barrel domain protein [Aspergillus brunneoviolaceus CBS 621.78]
MQISHIVLLQFKPDVGSDIQENVASRIKGLKDSCIHPETGKPYIVSMKGGVDVSIEGLQNGISHAFVSVFENASDRDYFAKTDPVHIALVKDVLQYLERVQVVDFVDGQLI